MGAAAGGGYSYHKQLAQEDKVRFKFSSSISKIHAPSMVTLRLELAN